MRSMKVQLEQDLKVLFQALNECEGFSRLTFCIQDED